MRRIAVLLSLPVALAVFQPTEEAAAAIQTFRPAADTYANQAHPHRSYGNAERLRIRGSSRRAAKQAYLRFAVAGLTGAVTRAKLRLYVANGTRNGPAAYRTAEWPRNPLTWARRPAVVSGPRDDKGRLAGGAWVDWDVTPWVRRDGAYRFALKRGTADAVRFMSRETTNKPRLVVTTFDPPSTVEYVAPREGATVSGITAVRVRAPAGTDWIGVYACGGLSVGEDLVMNPSGEWSVQWDTQMTGCSNGSQPLDTFAYRGDDSELGQASITVEVSNSSPPPPDPEPTPCAANPVPGPLEGQGYTLRFSDCFGTLSRSVWCWNQWWEPRPPLGTQYVEDGVLHLVRRRSDGYPNVTISTEPCGQDDPQSFQYGYIEARMRYDTVRGNGPAFWLLSTRHATNPNFEGPEPYDPNPYCQQHGLPVAECYSAELDVFEGYGNIQYGGTRTDDFFSGTLHRNSSGHYGAANQSRFVQHGTGLDLSQWHTYAALWTDSTVSYYIDGQLQGSVATFDSTRQPMHLLLYNWNTDWESENMPNASTPDRLDVSVDWVRVWQQ
jgi:Glycosyl hydrolases family 16